MASLYLDEFVRIFQEEVYPGASEHWDAAVAEIRGRSPAAGWMLGGAPSAPSGADPYILAGEVVSYLVKKHGIGRRVPDTLHTRAYEASQAPWREEVLEVIEALDASGVRVHFVSNSSTRKVAHRLDDLFAGKRSLRERVRVCGDAAKFRIQELSHDADIPGELRRRFGALPAALTVETFERPVYLRRGAYFEALCRVWNNEPSGPSQTLVCGDVWELDLAMPAALGAEVHLITREAPYATYGYERSAVEALGARGGMSGDLRGLLSRVRAAAS